MIILMLCYAGRGAEDSGKSAKDKLNDALALYESQVKSPFTMVALWSLLRGTPKWQEQLIATTSAVQKYKASKTIVDEENAVPAEIEAAGTPNGLPCPLGQNSVKRVAKENVDLAALASSSAVMGKAKVDAALHVKRKAEALELISKERIMRVDMIEPDTIQPDMTC